MAGSSIAQDDYYGKNDHTKKLECAWWLLKKFDGIVYLVTESDQKNTKLPDFIWYGRLWDLKTPVGCGKRTIDNQFKNIHKQIGNNPGGIIIDCSFTDLEAVSKRMMLCKLEGDVIIRKKDFVISILKKDRMDRRTTFGRDILSVLLLQYILNTNADFIIQLKLLTDRQFCHILHSLRWRQNQVCLYHGFHR